MVRKIEGFSASTTNEYPLMAMDGETRVGLDGIIRRIQDREDIEWQEGGGHGGFVGLSQAVSEAVTRKLLKCGDSCRMEAVISRIDEDAPLVGCSLILKCAGMEYSTEAAAVADEQQCEDHHRVVGDGFPAWVESTYDALTTAQSDLEDAQRRIDNAI